MIGASGVKYSTSREFTLGRVEKVSAISRVYASALAARRHFQEPRTLPEASTFAREFRWKGGRLRCVQAQDEIVWLLEMVRELAPRRVLEIGTANGGTLFLWTRVAAPDAKLVSVDMCPLGLLGRHSAFGDRAADLPAPGSASSWCSARTLTTRERAMR